MSKPIEAVTHQDERANIPTPELEPFMKEEDRRPIEVEFDRRNEDLDPQLIWRGKSITDRTFTVPAPPLYLQEQVHPKALIEDLKSGRSQDNELFGDLFGHFGVEDDDLEKELEFYQHPKKWSNRMILGDGLQVMASLAEREGLRGQVQAIYIDPPYGVKFNSNFQWTTTSREVKDGKLEHLTREPEQVKAFRDTWRDGIHSYLSYLRDRLVVARELLTESGSCFVQISEAHVHRVRALMDEVLGEENFVSQITFVKTMGQTDNYLSNNSDFLLWFARDKPKMKYRDVLEGRHPFENSAERYIFVEPRLGEMHDLTVKQKEGKAPIPDGRILKLQVPFSQTGSEKSRVQFPFCGRYFLPSGTRGWSTSDTGMVNVAKAGYFHIQGNGLWWKSYRDVFPYKRRSNYWTDTRIQAFLEDRTYVVQTSTRAIQNCLLMTTDPGDLVLDPTCGSGTTATVAEQWGRRWITIDTSRVALALAKARIMGAKYPFYLLADSQDGQKKEAEVTRSPQSMDKPHNDIRRGFVYQRVPHVTLKAIANNAEIDVIYERMQSVVEAALANLNNALSGQLVEFEVKLGGRAGDTINFNAAEGDTVTMPSGETAPKNGFMEWEVPREPGTPWPQDELKLLERAIKVSKSGKVPAAAQRALSELNHIRGTTWTQNSLPTDAKTPWPQDAVDALEGFWEARIARQKEIDASIAAKAESEFLYDKPYEDKNRVRVAGPFTVESLSPHRTPAVGPNDELIDPLDASQGNRDEPGSEQETYYKAMIENLKAAGVHQQEKGDRIVFSSITPWPGTYIGAEGRYLEGGADDDPDSGQERRAAIVIGPEYGTVQRADLMKAGREALDAGFDILIVCAFNFDSHAEADRLGDLKILRARMNPDLHMAGDLQEGGGNLFVVFGEPDIELLEAPGNRVKVKINGVDVFKPQTGEVVSTGPEGIACWFVDTDYSGESFFVRQAYFLGANDPYKSLKTTLKDEIDEEAWASLNSDTSRAFKRPESGKIAVKAINHLGDEVMKIFEVS